MKVRYRNQKMLENRINREATVVPGGTVAILLPDSTGHQDAAFAAYRAGELIGMLLGVTRNEC